jgi:hypothetical protein
LAQAEESLDDEHRADRDDEPVPDAKALVYPSATVRAMIKVKAATVPQFLTRESDLATSSFPSVGPVGGVYSPPRGGGATTVAAREARRPPSFLAAQTDPGEVGN